MSAAAHSPGFPPGTRGAWPEMKTKPFATTQWEYGPTGLGWLGSSGVPLMSPPARDWHTSPKGCVPSPPPPGGLGRIVTDVSISDRLRPFPPCKGLLNWDVVREMESHRAHGKPIGTLRCPNVTLPCALAAPPE